MRVERGRDGIGVGERGGGRGKKRTKTRVPSSGDQEMKTILFLSCWWES